MCLNAIGLLVLSLCGVNAANSNAVITSVVVKQTNNCPNLYVYFNVSGLNESKYSIREVSTSLKSKPCKVSSSTGICYFTPFFYGDDFQLKLKEELVNKTKRFSRIFIGKRVLHSPLTVKVKEVGKKFITLQWYSSWNATCVAGNEFYQFQEKCTSSRNESCSLTISSDVDQICSKINGVNQYLCTRKIENLHPYTRYTYSVKFKTQKEFYKGYNPSQYWSNWSKIISFTTKSEEPQIAPYLQCNAKVSSVHISWKKPFMSTEAGNITYFKLHINRNTKTVAVNKQDIYSLIVPTDAKLMIAVSACSDTGCTPTLKNSTCTAEPLPDRRTITYVVVTAVIVFLFVVSVGFFIWKKTQYCEKNVVDEDGDEMIRPRVNAPSSKNLSHEHVQVPVVAL